MQLNQEEAVIWDIYYVGIASMMFHPGYQKTNPVLHSDIAIAAADAADHMITQRRGRNRYTTQEKT